MNLLSQNINKITHLCKVHKVKKLYAFGAVFGGGILQTASFMLKIRLMAKPKYELC